MSEKKKIDRLFQERFRDFEAVPNEEVWKNIEARLAKEKKRRVIPIWWRLSGVAAALVIGFLVYDYFAHNGNNQLLPANQVVGTEYGNAIKNQQSPADNAQIPEGNANEKSGIDVKSPGSRVNSVAGSTPGESDKNDRIPVNVPKEAVAESTNRRADQTDTKSENNRIPNKKTNNVLKNTDKTAIAASPKSQTHNEKEKQNAVANQGIANNKERNADRPGESLQAIQRDSRQPQPGQSQITTNQKDVTPYSTAGIAVNTEPKKDSTGIATVGPNALEELLNEKENNVTAKEQKINRWQITSNVAPIYFSSVSNGSPLDSRFENNKKNYTASLSYGVGAKYALNKKWSIKSGVNAVALEYNTSDVVFFQTDNARRIENVTPNMAGSFIQVDNKPEDNSVAILGRARNQFGGNVNQKIGYVEVPVEMAYKIVDKKFGMEVIGGVSTLFLNQNEVSIVSPGLEMTIGEANNLNSVHFSTNVGVGFKYNFLKSFQANVEPMLKYQINTFSNDSGNFKPFFLGLYTGVSYRF